MRIFLKSDLTFYLSLVLLGVGAFFVALIHPAIEGFYSAIVVAAAVGIGVTLYIYYAKRFKKSLACPSGDACNTVVTSRYSKFLGIPLEYLGFFYYAVIALSYCLFILSTSLRESLLLPAVLVLTAAAFLFSLYLIFVQAVLLRKWCIWCLLSATISTIIFVLALVSLDAAGGFLSEITAALAFVKNLGFIFGLGGATAASFLFIKFLDDFNISKREASVLKELAELVWFGLGLIFVSKYAHFVANTAELASSHLFLAEIAVLSVIFIVGALLMTLFTPFLEVMPFKKRGGGQSMPSPLATLRKATVLAGSVAVASWFFVYIINTLPEYSLGTYLTAYGATLALALIASIAWQQRFK